MNVVITGGKDYHFDSQDYHRLDALHSKHQFANVSVGGQRGAEECAAFWAYLRGIPLQSIPINKTEFGKFAFKARNPILLQDTQLVIAFPGDNSATRQLLMLARNKNIPIEKIQ